MADAREICNEFGGCGDALRRPAPPFRPDPDHFGGTWGGYGRDKSPSRRVYARNLTGVGVAHRDLPDPVSFSVAAAAELVGEYSRLRRNSTLQRR